MYGIAMGDCSQQFVCAWNAKYIIRADAACPANIVSEIYIKKRHFRIATNKILTLEYKKCVALLP